jgi:catechol 2,3-dioxygenase-like lactoylglutathione lyase family enzyme
MAKVIGIGGVFFKAKDPKGLGAWYRTHLGVDVQPWGGAAFDWNGPDNPTGAGTTAWSLFPADTKHFAPSGAPFMINYRVDDLDRLLADLRAAGVPILQGPEAGEYGAFAWIADPEGNKVELWEPTPGDGTP